MALFVAATFTQCKKDPVCDLILRVNKTVDGLTAAEPVKGAHVKVGIPENYADFAKAEGYTNSQGVFTHTFKYECLLDAEVTYQESFEDADGNTITIDYQGNARVKLNPNETTEAVVLLIPSSK